MKVSINLLTLTLVSLHTCCHGGLVHDILAALFQTGALLATNTLNYSKIAGVIARNNSWSVRYHLSVTHRNDITLPPATCLSFIGHLLADRRRYCMEARCRRWYCLPSFAILLSVSQFAVNAFLHESSARWRCTLLVPLIDGC